MRWTRRIAQGAFLLTVLFGVFVVQGNAERWCPFGGMEAIYTYWSEGDLVCSLGFTNFYALAGLLVSVLLLRRAFCGYLCPIGAVGEWVGKLSIASGAKPFLLPRTWDRVLSLLKYAVLVAVLYATGRAGELLFRGYDPCYALLSRHGEDITVWAYVISSAIVVGSVFVSVPFCRWLCPLAAVMNPFSSAGLARVRRDRDACCGCGACSTTCPMAIPVDKLSEVKAARCTSCLECVATCSRSHQSALTWTFPWVARRSRPQVVILVLLSVALMAVVTTAWTFPIASFVKEHRIAERPARTAIADLRIRGVRCRGTAHLLTYFLFRDDVSKVPGYLKVEAWPEEGYSRVHITYDPSKTDAEAIQSAIVEPYFDRFQQFERFSPFEIDGYAPWSARPAVLRNSP